MSGGRGVGLSAAALWLWSLAVAFFLVAPLVVVIPASLTTGYVAHFPPEGLTLKWYQDFLRDRYWVDALGLSVRLGASVAVLSTTVGIMAAVALTRFVSPRAKPSIRVFVLGPMIVPLIVSGAGMFDLLSRINLAGTFPGLLIAHMVLALPFSVIVIENGFLHFDATLEAAARTLGASRLAAFRRVTLPLILPSVLGSAVFAFVTSFDEVVVVLLVGGPWYQTLPVKMYIFMQNEFAPTIAAVASLLVVGLFAVLGLIQLEGLRRAWRERKALREEQISFQSKGEVCSRRDWRSKRSGPGAVSGPGWKD